MRYFIFILALLLAAPVFSVAQPLERDGAPFIGAQVFIEPGQTDAQVTDGSGPSGTMAWAYAASACSNHIWLMAGMGASQ